MLPTLPAGCADLVFADPPFNIGYKYDRYNDRGKTADYFAWVNRWCVRVLSPAGSLWLAINDEGAWRYQQLLEEELGLHWRNTAIWTYRFGPHQKCKFGRNHGQLLYYTRHKKRFTFNADAVRIPSDRQTRYRDKRANPRGRVPDDV